MAMKLRMCIANLSSQDRWEHMQRMGFILYIFQWTLIYACGGAVAGLLLAYIHKLHENLSAGVISAAIVGALFAGFSWRSAKKKASDSNS
jgi:hypothetical protein